MKDGGQGALTGVGTEEKQCIGRPPQAISSPVWSAHPSASHGEGTHPSGRLWYGSARAQQDICCSVAVRHEPEVPFSQQDSGGRGPLPGHRWVPTARQWCAQRLTLCGAAHRPHPDA